jgi:hypothetical protein
VQELRHSNSNAPARISGRREKGDMWLMRSISATFAVAKLLLFFDICKGIGKKRAKKGSKAHFCTKNKEDDLG